jgi:Na+-driven multidrug efflux pump
MKGRNINLLSGSIWKSILWFAIPLLIGNLFQQLYNTADAMVVGNFVGKNALAAVGASSPIINTLIGLFMGIAAGAGVVIANYFGANDIKKLKKAVHTSAALTLVMSVILTIIGLVATNPILKLVGIPEDIFDNASLYLAIYFGGISFALIYNMGAGVLRAIGDSKRPLYFFSLSECH